MATPRKKNKVRDYDKTRQKMLEVVGEILRDTGYAGLKTNNIARRLGKDKNLIRYYFSSLVNLERTYIKENDYWFAFFETFNLSASPPEDEIRRFFTKLMLENFEFFSDNIEMQKIILWQISENNPLMRSLSDQREIEGEKLLRMTDPYFTGTDTSFRAVIAVLLGGIYYMVLHARTNRSTVCSIDINMATDRKLLADTIGQIIGWAWDHSRGEAPILFSRWQAIMAELKMRNLDATFLEIISLPFKRIEKGEGHEYAQTFADAIENFMTGPETDFDQFLMLLVSLNFNHSRFVAYCANHWRKQCRHLPPENAIGKLMALKAILAELGFLTIVSFEARNKPVKEQLTAWIDEKLGFLAARADRNEDKQSLQSKLEAVQQAYLSVQDRDALEPIERKLEEMLAEIRKRLH